MVTMQPHFVHDGFQVLQNFACLDSLYKILYIVVYAIQNLISLLTFLTF